MLIQMLRAPTRTLALCAALLFATSCGLDDKPNCGPGQVLCGNACVDVSNDPAHCGACDTTCDEASVCDLGRCSATCTSGTDACDGVCRDLDTDLANCGACGIACGTDEVCSAGMCGAECTGALEACDGVCRDLRADPLHCGACGTTCAADQVCTDGLCAPTCASALTDCGGACRDLETDADHCGACGVSCAATQVCSEGACADVCADGLTACDADCVDLAADPRHCGDCVTACAVGEDCSVGVCGDTQDPPVFISTPVVTVDEDVLYTYAIVANDLDGNSTLSLTASTLPAWMTIVDNGDGTATLSGTPTQAEIGVHAVVLVASDGTTSVEQTFDVTVVAVDDAPVFLTTPVLTGGDDVVYTYLVEVTDEEGAVVTVTATTLPVWLAFTDNGDGTYTLAGTPTDAEIGGHDVVLEASDGMLTTLQSFTVTISDVNDVPVFTSMEVLTATEDVTYTYDVTTTDTDVGATLTLSAPTLPSWLVFTDNGDGTATLTGTPTNANVGNHDVELVVTDGSAMVSQSFTIVVTNTNDAPTFTSIAVLTATEDAPYAYAIAAGDVDLMDTLAISDGGLPGWLSLTDNGDGTATLTGTPTNADVGSVGVTLTVTDVAGETGTQMFTIVVAPVNDPPAFTSTPITSGTQDAAYAYAITTTDEESAPLTILATVRPGWLAFTDNGNGTASLSGTPGSADIGTHDVTLTVSDGVTTITQTFQIIVGDVNDAPEFTSTPITAATEDALYTYAIVTTDADAGAMLTISQTVLPAWLTFTDNGDGTATLSGTPTNAHVGSHPVTLGVSDGTLSATQMFTIVVTNTNDAPSFTSTAPTSATQNALYTYAITTTDPDVGAILDITSTTLPAWLAFVDNNDGTATLSGTPGPTDVANVDVTLTVTDGTAPATQVFTIIVGDVNDAPSFTSIPITTATEDSLYSYAITTTDPDAGATLVISATTLPGWLTFIDNGNGTASLTGTPINTDVGSHPVVLRVTDGTTPVTQMFSIVVTNTNDAPSFTSAAVTTATEDAAYTYAITTTDPDVGATLTLTAPTLPAWLTFTPGANGSGTLSGTPTNANVGPHDVVLSVTDGTTSIQQSFTITVTNTNDAPTFTSTPVTSVFATNLYTYAITTADIDAGDTRTITSSTLPAWLTLTDNGNGTATLSGTPAISDAGTVNVTLTANDGDATATQVFTITVNTQPPVAANYTYAVIGNTELVAESAGTKLAVPRGNVFLGSSIDLRTNAMDPDTAPATLTVALGTGPTSGSLQLFADGSFSYAPNANFIGTDTFTYTLSDGTNTSGIGTVTLNVASRVWYVNNLTNADNAGAKNPVGGNGTSLDAFDTIAAFDAVVSSAGETIFIAQGDSAYDAADANGLDLLANQRVIGQAADLIVGANTLSVGVPGARPTIVGSIGTAITLGNDNTIAGVRLTTTAATNCLRANAVTGGTLNDVLVEPGPTGAGVYLTSHTGTFTYTTGTISAAILGASLGLVLDGASSPIVNLNNVTISGVSVGFSSAVSGADVTFNGGGINLTTGGRAIAVSSAAAGASLVFAAGASVTATGVASGDIIAITVASTEYDATFGNVTLGGAAADEAIALSGLGTSSVLTFGGTNTITNVGGDAIEILGTGTQAPVFTFAGLSITGAAGTDIRVDGGSPSVTVTSAGINNTAGSSVSVSNTTGANVAINGPGTLTDTAGGIRITSNTNSTVTFGANVTVTPPSGTAGIVATPNTGSTLTFGTLDVTTVAASGISINTAANLTITNGTLWSGGAIGSGLGLALALIGNANVTMTSTSVTNLTGGGVSITTVGGTTRLGALAVSTAMGGTGLLANNGGTVTTTTGTIASTTGVAVSLTNTTPTMNLVSVSASGAANGIVLNGTGTGSFTVTGTGSTAASGGTIQNVSGDAVSLTTARNVDLRNMDLTTVGGNGIGSTIGAGVDNLDLSGVRITNAGNAVNEAGIYITTNLTGACNFSSVLITGSAENNVEIVQTSGTLGLTVGTSTFSQNSFALGANGFLLETRNTAVATATFTGTTFSQNAVTHLRANAIDTSDLTVNVSASTFTATPANDTINGIVLTNGDGADLTFDVDNNTFNGPTSVTGLTAHTALYVVSADTGTINAPINGYFRNNGTISNQNFGVVIDVRNNAPHALAIVNNAFGSVRTRAIDYISGVDGGDAPVGHLTITGNSCTATAAGADSCALITPTQSSALCTNVRQNTFVATAVSMDMSVAAPATMRIESSGTDCGGVCANATAHLNARNTLLPGATTTGVTLATPGMCALPSLL